MGIAHYLHAAVDAFVELPGIRHAGELRYRRLFARNGGGNMFRGVFGSYEEAAADVPSTFPLGYDNPASASMYLDRLEVLPTDYPAMFWLGRCLARGATTVADLGGSVGIKYFAFRRVLDFPASMRWKVIDVPAVVERGREFAATQPGGDRLEFGSDLADDVSDVLFVSGAHQYLREPLYRTLSGRQHRYPLIILNTTAVHPVRSFYTLNGIGTAFCVYQVCAEQELVAGFGRLGYTVRDRWRNPGKQIEVPFQPGLGAGHFSGFCFELSA